MGGGGWGMWSVVGPTGGGGGSDGTLVGIILILFVPARTFLGMLSPSTLIPFLIIPVYFNPCDQVSIYFNSELQFR
jgi:hypothetical protein